MAGFESDVVLGISLTWLQDGFRQELFESDVVLGISLTAGADKFPLNEFESDVVLGISLTRWPPWRGGRRLRVMLF